MDAFELLYGRRKCHSHIQKALRQDLRNTPLEESSALVDDELPVPNVRVDDRAVAKVQGQPQNESGNFPMPDEACYNSLDE